MLGLSKQADRPGGEADTRNGPSKQGKGEAVYLIGLAGGHSVMLGLSKQAGGRGREAERRER